MSLEYNKNLIPFAKSLRKNATPQENHLWYDFLRSYTPRFQRQKTIGQFIADFYCEKAKLNLLISTARPKKKKRSALSVRIKKQI